MGDLGQTTVDFSTLLARAAEDSYMSLNDLVQKSMSTSQSDSDKKLGLLKYLVKTQQRMLRLHVLAKWCQQVPLIQYSQQLASTLSSHDTCFTQTADSLFFMHEGLQQARAPAYDIPSAVEVLLTGNYQRLPKCIEDVGVQSTLPEDQKKPTLKKLDTLVHSKLLEISLPKEISEVRVSDGTAMLRVDGEFKVLLTLGYRGHLSLWRILHLDLLVAEKGGPMKFEEHQRYALGDDLERRMTAAENPFSILYSVLHEFCITLIMDTVILQVKALLHGRWKDAIRFELISDGTVGQAGNSGSVQTNQDGEAESTGSRTPGLKIVYWLDFDRNSGTSDSGSCPFIKIEPGSDLQIKCLHSTFVVDPVAGKEAEFLLDQTCIDVEEMVLKAIWCNRYTRLLEIQKELSKNGQICRFAADAILSCPMYATENDYKKKGSKTITAEYEGWDVLHVHAYGLSFFTLGIHIRKGHFFLQSSRKIITPSALVDCEDALNQGSMTTADVFSSLRNKSILHLFASIGRFLGLEVYEQGFSAMKLPKNILNSSNLLLMGFPDCGNSYFLLMQLDKDFKPLFSLLETQRDPSQETSCPSEMTNVIRIKEVDIGKMKMLNDELNLSLLDWEKILSTFPNSGRSNQTIKDDLLDELGLETSMKATVPSSSFSSIVDRVFDLENGSAVSSSIQNVGSSFNVSYSHFGSVAMNIHTIKAGTPSPKWDGSTQISQCTNVSRVSNAGPHFNGSIYSSSNLNANQSSSVSSLSSGSLRSATVRKLTDSKSDQDIASLISPHSVEASLCTSLDEGQNRLMNVSSKEISGRTPRLLSPPHMTCTGAAVSNGLRNSPTGSLVGSFKTSEPGIRAQAPGSIIFQDSRFHSFYEHDKIPQKRSHSDMLDLISSLEGQESSSRFSKKQRLINSVFTRWPSSQVLISPEMISKSEGHSYENLIAAANKGNAPSIIYVSSLLHVVRHCSLCIKHARLTGQMEVLDIPYVEEVGLKNPSSNLWFRLPITQDDSWPHICVRLGKPGSMCWDAKINYQHFKDLWDLQKGCNTTPWGTGIRFANTSDADSHIKDDPEGVVLSYQTVDPDSIKKLVADIQRLFNARVFSLGMRKLLGIRAGEKLEESSINIDAREAGVKGVIDPADKLSEQTRKAFRIEAVGLMSLWFSLGLGVLAHFVVEWESGKEGCTIHISPELLWPHTKFLEDFINGNEVALLLDCIRLTAGPLQILASAIRPARVGPGTIPFIPKHSGYTTSQLPLPTNSTANPTQPITVLTGSSITSPPAGALGISNPHAAAASAARGGPGIVPSSLLPIDVSVVLRCPYWIRIVYRKYFAVDMRCFAGDQVWLQPATPPKGGPSLGGSLPCPQLRPFIMELIGQELNVLEPNLSSEQQTVGFLNLTNTNPSLSSQLIASSSGMLKPGNQLSCLNTAGTALTGSSALAASSSGVPLRRSHRMGVPAHVRGELNTAIIGLGDDGPYGGGWVPLVALKKVLRGILKYLGVLWLFAQLPDLLKEILGSILKDNEGTLLNLDQEQPALRFFVGGYVFAVSVHRVQLLLQVLSVKRFHQQQPSQHNSVTTQEELAQSEITEICDYFSRRVASEPYDASRVASFITLLTLPISVLREFLKLIAWKKGVMQAQIQAQSGDTPLSQKPRIELSLENHAGFVPHENPLSSRSNVRYDRPHNFVDFGLTIVLDPALIPPINAAGGGAWLPYCVLVRVRYSFGESPNVLFLGMQGSHGGRACWLRHDEWDKCKQKVAQTFEINVPLTGDVGQGRLKLIADSVQKTLHLCLKGLKDGTCGVTLSSATT